MAKIHFVFFYSPYLEESQEMVIWGMAKIFGGFQGSRDDAEDIWYEEEERFPYGKEDFLYYSKYYDSNESSNRDDIIALELGKVKMFDDGFISMEKVLSKKLSRILVSLTQDGDQNVGNLYIDLSTKNEIFQLLENKGEDISEVFDPPETEDFFSNVSSYSNELLVFLIRSREKNNSENKRISDSVKSYLNEIEVIELIDSLYDKVNNKEFDDIKESDKNKLVVHLVGSVDISRGSNNLLQRANINKGKFPIIEVILPETIPAFVKITNYKQRVDFRNHEDVESGMNELKRIIDGYLLVGGS